MKTYNNYYGTASINGDIQRIIGNSFADNLTWGLEVVNDSIRYLVAKYYFNERTYVVPGGTVAQQQFYNLPGNVKEIINVTINIGAVLWQPKECPSRQYWDLLNVIQFYQDFPSFFFVYNGQVGIYPIPASNSNILTINYKTRIIDLSIPDVTDGTAGSTTLTVTNASTAVTSSATLFRQWMAGQWLRVPFNATDANSGDNQWYQIASVTNSTTAVLKVQYTGATATVGNGSGNFTIGQAPILHEDYQDLPLYRMGIIYYTTRFPDPIRAGEYQKLWDEGTEKLNEEFGSKTNSIVLTDTDAPLQNPNLFVRTVS